MGKRSRSLVWRMAWLGLAVFAGMGLVQFTLLGLSAMDSFGKVEDQTSIEHARRARSAVERERSSLLDLTRDRAAWDELIEAVARRDLPALPAIFPDSWSERTRMDLVMVRDGAGQVLWAAIRENPESRLLPTSAGALLPFTLPAAPPALGQVDILMTARGPLLFATVPITDSADLGADTLTLGRYFAREPVVRIARSLQVRVGISASRDALRRTISDGSQGWFDVSDEGLDRDLAVPLSSTDGPDALYLLLTYTMDSRSQAIALLAQMALSYGVTAALAVFLAFSLIRRTTLQPVLRVAAHLDRAVAGEAAAPLGLGEAAGRFDEIGILADRVDQLIAAERQRKEELAAVNRELERRASTDALTGLANRRFFAERLEREKRRLLREQRGPGCDQMAFIVGDIDCFKLYNDRYGHRSGDVCLRAVADAIQGALARPTDFACRQGGEEFLVMLPGTDEAGGLVVGERIREAVESLGLEHADSLAAPLVTLSLGVAARRITEDFDEQELFELADAALYRAKAAGRNRVAGSTL